MKRKRFIKLVMSIGFPKKEAVRIANFYHHDGWTYKEAWIDSFFLGIWD